jgi:hypothetical protein
MHPLPLPLSHRSAPDSTRTSAYLCIQPYTNYYTREVTLICYMLSKHVTSKECDTIPVSHSTRLQNPILVTCYTLFPVPFRTWLVLNLMYMYYASIVIKQSLLVLSNYAPLSKNDLKLKVLRKFTHCLRLIFIRTTRHRIMAYFYIIQWNSANTQFRGPV